ncbi:hypothetical protein TIFTF001_028303 [Ficus carica]|uniref:Phospholipid-transporting ATPase n=1 Tax=Ficus carica TaxID=3494 RepID=A0AA88J110_FICCA|nr:hypothetical protein TIFTF001_028303 [Ficus carica]
MDSKRPTENSLNIESGTSRRGIATNSVREVNFGDHHHPRGTTAKHVRHGSRAGDSEAFSMSQREINDDDARLVYVNDPVKTNERFEFARNSIRTGKYSILTFLPRNLFEQFHRVAYIYFLVIAVLNQLPQLAVFGRGASILPLAFVLLVTTVKDAYEDYRRHRSDRIENNRLALVLVNNQFHSKRWKDIQVGEIIKIQANETLPCDIVLLSTSDPTGVAYVQTINLDGESNLKTRYAKQETLSKFPEKEKIGGLIRCEKPNRNIYGFQANLEIDGKKLSLGPSNVVLRGCELKNTVWAIGVAVYAGRETKAMLNSSGASCKRSRLESRMNFEIIILSMFLIALCTVVSVCAALWLRRHRHELDFLPFYRRKDYSEGKVKNYNYYGWGMEIFFTFLMSVIVFQIMIPISLYISMELIRVGQAYFMIGDTQLYDETSNSRFQCRALNINEDLGQIKYVFSDKTGTLTENKMEFQCASIGGVDYSGGKGITEKDHAGYSVQVDGIILRPKMRVNADPELQQLAKSRKDTIKCKQVHDFFLALAACNAIVPLVIDTPDPTVKLIDYQGESPDEQALVYAAATYGFMLVERTSGHIVIDIQGQRQRSRCSFTFLRYHAKIGVMILFITVTSFTTSGVCIHSFCRTSNNEESCIRSLQEATADMAKKLMAVSGVTYDTEVTSVASLTPAALIVDGTSLVYILDSELEEQLFELASKCCVVLCCRVAPLQKAGIVALVKNRTADMTLAIGDGANDVSMIQMADVGVGISGQEGRQAVMASDFAMGQYVLFTCFTLTTAITEWSSVLYSVLYTSLPTIVVGILDKNLSRRTLLKYPQLYGAGHRQECYNSKFFWLTMMDTVWQSLVAFFIPVFAYWGSNLDASSMGDLWTIAVVILVNLHLAMDVVRWTWITHAAIWGSIIATFICVTVIDAFPSLVGYWYAL